jgi:hypothetical protein
MTYYAHFNDPTAAQNDDIDIVEGALALARAIRDDVVTSPFSYRVFVEGIGTTIRTASHRINHVAASKEVWQFGAYVADTAHEDLDDLICDYLSSAQALVEGGL